MSSGALTEMRSATRDLHTKLEEELEITAPDAGIQEYLHYLQDLWGWMHSFEEQLWQAEWPAAMNAAERSGKLPWIETDLHFAGLTSQQIDALPLASFKPNLSTLAACFGVAYVIEGSQLGTKVLQRRLAPQLGTWSPRWLEGYGARNADNWRAFMQCAEAYLDTPARRSEAAGSAAAAFESLATWFGQRRNARAASNQRAQPIAVDC